MADWKEALDRLECEVPDLDEASNLTATIRTHIEGLEAERRHIVQERDNTFRIMLQRAEAAEARVRKLEVNASRYLYLRDNTSVMIDRGDGWMSGCWLTSHRLDAALDAAREG